MSIYGENFKICFEYLIEYQEMVEEILKNFQS